MTAVAGIVDALGKEFLPRAALALDEDGRAVPGHDFGLADDVLHAFVDGLDVLEWCVAVSPVLESL